MLSELQVLQLQTVKGRKHGSLVTALSGVQRLGTAPCASARSENATIPATQSPAALVLGTGGGGNSPDLGSQPHLQGGEGSLGPTQLRARLSTELVGSCQRSTASENGGAEGACV